jgi:hypothetical protein
MRREHGFSLVEMTIAMGLTMVVVASVFSIMNPAQGAFAVEPEVADMQQRLRVAEDTLFKDLVMAGAGAYIGGQTGSLNYFFAPVLPFRQGAVGDAPNGSFARHGGPPDTTDTITVIYVPSTTVQTTLRTAVIGGGPLHVNRESDCPAGQGLCGFKVGMTVLIFDNNGNYDTFTINSVADAAGDITVNKPADAATTTYAVGSKVVQAISRTYFLKKNSAARLYQLVSYDGSTGPDLPVVDNVVDLSFEYWGDPNPPLRTTKPLTDPVGPWTTYGPKPPVAGLKPTAYPAGENCVFLLSPPETGLPAPRLALLPSGTNSNTLVKLTEAQVTDGPWCPDVASANRFDADLLRIRKIAVNVRVQAALSAMRGPASVLFRYGGTSTSATRWIPDQELKFQVSPRNLNLGR